MSSIIKKLQNKSKASAIDFEDIATVDCDIHITEPLNAKGMLNSRVEDFITLVYFNKRMFLMGFMGRTCISKEIKISEVNNVDNKAFTFSIKRNFLKILEGKEELKFKLKDGNIEWSFKYGNGYIARKMKPTSSLYEIKKYLDFLLNCKTGNSQGTVNSIDIKNIHRKLEKIEGDSMSRNVVLGRGYIYSVLPTFAIYKPADVDADTLLTESIISNIPKREEDFEVRVLNGFTGLIGKRSSLHYIFPSMSTKNLIDSYTELRIKWVASIKELDKPIKVLTFGNKEGEMELIFDSKTQTVKIKEMSNDNNQYVGMTEVMEDATIKIDPTIQDFKDLNKIGRVTDKNREHIKSIMFDGGEICLIR